MAELLALLAQVSWHWPAMLWLWPLPAVVRFACRPARPGLLALQLPVFSLLRQSIEQTRPARGKLALAWLLWTLLLIAAARPYGPGKTVEQPAQGRDLMLAVDLSHSMQVRDMRWQGKPVDRLAITKALLGDFIHRRQGDRLGLILFADGAYLQAPLIHDHRTVGKLLDEASIGLVGKSTAIGDAIALAVKRLARLPGERQKALILLTDGKHTSGRFDPLQAADAARSAGIRIYAIGLGSERAARGGTINAQLRLASDELDEALLQQIAQHSGGRYFRARDPEQLEQIYRQLDQLEPRAYQAPPLRLARPLFHWPLGAALLLSLAPLLARLIGAACRRAATEEARP